MQPEVMYENPTVGFDGMLRGFVGGSAQTRDPFITKQVTRYLFASDPVHGFGEDLMSLNMQRGRDHGLPGMLTMRQTCAYH
jgi:peroxidase